MLYQTTDRGVRGSVRPRGMYVMSTREVYAGPDGGERCVHDQHKLERCTWVGRIDVQLGYVCMWVRTWSR
jgi:hypothetical protein